MLTLEMFIDFVGFSSHYSGSSTGMEQSIELLLLAVRNPEVGTSTLCIVYFIAPLSN